MKKRTVSLILCVLMVLTLIPVSSYAITGPQPNKATLKFETLTLMDGQEEMASTPVTDRYNVGVPDELNVGDVFYLGIKLCDMNNVPEFTDGLFSIAIPFEYNNAYLTWEGPTQANKNSNDRIDADTTGLYEVITDELSNEFMYTSNYGASGTRLTFTLDYALDYKPAYNGGNTNLSDEYIAITKFTVKALPEGTDGADSLKILTDDQLTAAFGNNGNSMNYSYQGSGKNDNLEWVMDFDDSGVNLFPKQAGPLGGTASITGTTTYGETLEVDVTQVTGTTNFKYQWTDGTNNIAGATNKTFKVDKPALVGKTLKCVVSPADPTEASGSVTATAATAIGKKQVTLTESDVTVSNKTFNNNDNATATITFPSSEKVNTSDVVNVAVASAKFDNKNAGNNKTVSVTAGNLSGAAANGYEITNSAAITKTANITKAQLTVAADNMTVKVGADVTLSGKVTGAVTGADPGMSYTYAVKDGSTDVITVSGDKAHGVAAGSKLVTVTGAITDTINYEFAAGKGTADATVTVSEKAPTGITIKTQPTKLAYEAGETLDLTGLTVNVTYDDNTNEDVAFADFADKGISASPVDGTVLAVSDNGKPVTVTVGTKSATTNNLTVVAAATKVTLKTKGDATKVYDNSTAFGKAVWTTEPVFESNNGTVDTSKAVYTFADKNAGTCEITVTGLTVNGAPASISGSVADGTITKADPELVIGNLAQRVGNVTALTAETVPADDKAIADKFTYEIDIKTTDGGINFVDWDDANVNGLQAGSYNVVVNYAGSENTNATTEAAILVLSKRSSGGGSSSVREYTVRFAAGEHGTIDGKTSVSVEKDAKLKSSDVPTVKADEGYKFIGWSLDGKTVVDPTKEAVTSSLSYTALYQQSNAHKTYMSGYSDGTFRPDGRTTRAEVASLMAGLIEGFDKDAAYNSTLNDIEDAAWYAQAVKFMSQKGLISGYDDGSYRPNNQITRQEFCAIIAKYMGLNGEGTANFNDVAEAWGKGYIGQLAAKGIVNGYPDGSFQPDKAITRAEVVTILNKVFDRTPDAELVDENIGNYTVRLSDVSKNHWAYTQILEAAIEHETADFHK